MDIKKSIAICMAEKGINQAKLAEIMAVKESSISRIMVNNVCSMPTLKALAEVFAMPVSEFIKKGETNG